MVIEHDVIAGYVASSVKKKEMNAAVQFSFLLSILNGTRAQGVVEVTFRMDFPFSVKQIHNCITYPVKIDNEN